MLPPLLEYCQLPCVPALAVLPTTAMPPKLEPASTSANCPVKIVAPSGPRGWRVLGHRGERAVAQRRRVVDVGDGDRCVLGGEAERGTAAVRRGADFRSCVPVFRSQARKVMLADVPLAAFGTNRTRSVLRSRSAEALDTVPM